MTQKELIDYLKNSCGCIVLRIDNKGYAVMRNVINAKMSGVPVAVNPNGHLNATTVCHICRNLDVDIPDEAIKAVETIDFLRSKFPDNRKD